MKKRYKTPEATTFELVQAQPVLVGASQIETEIDPGITVGDDDDTFVKRGRGGDVWDDDWSR